MIDEYFDDNDRYKEYIGEIIGYYGAEDSPHETKPLSQLISELRQQQKLSYEQLEKITGVQRQVLEKVENQSIYLDVGTVARLSKGLRTAAGLSQGEDSLYSYSIIRKGDRQKIRRENIGSQDRTDIEYRSLSRGVKSRHMESFLVTLSGENVNTNRSRHDGEEFIIVLEGTIKILLGDKEEILQAGDTIYYHSTIPHCVIAASKGQPAVFLGVIYTGC